MENLILSLSFYNSGFPKIKEKGTQTDTCMTMLIDNIHNSQKLDIIQGLPTDVWKNKMWSVAAMKSSKPNEDMICDKFSHIFMKTK